MKWKFFYRRSYLGPDFTCKGNLVTPHLLSDIHEESCVNHVGRSLVQKYPVGYYSPNMGQNANKFLMTFDKCKMFEVILRQPVEKSSIQTNPWHFMQR